MTDVQTAPAEQPSTQDLIREEVKRYLDGLFTNPVMLDSLASAVFSRGVAAFNFRAEHSTQRLPTLVVSESYIPGAIRVTINEQGEMVAEEQSREATTPHDQWQPSPSVNDDPMVNVAVKELALSYGAVADKAYYVLDDISLDTYRKELSEKVRRKVEDQAAAQQREFAEAMLDPQVAQERAAEEGEKAIQAGAKAFDVVE